MLKKFSRRSRGQETIVNPIGNLLDLLRDNYLKRPDEMLMICPYGIGDTYFACGLAEHVLKNRKKKNLHVLCSSHQRFIPPSFNENWLASSIPDWVDVRVLKESGPLSDNFLYAYFQTNESTNLLGYKGITLLDAYRARFDLPLDAPLTKPNLISPEHRRRVKQFFTDHGLPTHKTALLAPEAVSVGELDVKFWQTLSDQLKKKGWKVILNSDKYKAGIDHDAVSGVLGLDRVPAIAEEAGLVIGLRSGLCDLISSVNSHLVVVYPDVQWHAGTMIEATGLKSMGLSKSADEIVFESPSKTIQQIMSVI